MRALRVFLALVIVGLATAAYALSSAQFEVLFGGAPQPSYYADLTQTGSTVPSGVTSSRAGLTMIVDSTGAVTFAPNNLTTNTLFSGATGSGVFPTGWGKTGSQAVQVTTNAASVVNGISTNTISFRQPAAPGFLGFQSTQVVPANVEFLVSAFIRIPTSVTANDCLFYQQSSFTLANAATLNAATKDTWINYYGVDAVNTAPFGLISFVNSNSAATGTGWDFALPVVSAVTYETSPRPRDQVITNGASFYGPGFPYTYGAAPVALGMQNEGSQTNLFLNSIAPGTQTIAVANGASYTVSFYGAGTLTISGALTQTMVGAAGVRTTYTGMSGSTSLTATVSGLSATAYPQVEAGGFATSPIVTSASSVTRAADSFGLTGAASASAAIGYTIEEYQNEQTGVITRQLFAPGAFAFTNYAYIRKIAIYPPGLSSAQLTPLLNLNRKLH